VVIDVTSGDLTGATVSPAQLTFTPLNWAAPQTVTLTGVGDAVDDIDQTFNIAVAMDGSTDTDYAALEQIDVSVTVTDIDTAGVTVTPGTTTFSENGGTGSFTVVLNTAAPAPDGNVVIDVTSSDITEALVDDVFPGSPAATTSLTFTPGNYNTPQTVYLTGVNSADGADGRRAFNIVNTNGATLDTTGYASLNPDDVPVIVLDDEWVPRQTSCVWRSVASSSTGQYIVAVIYNTTSGETAGIWTSSNYGQDWVQRSSVGRNYYSVASDSTGQYLAAAVENGYIYISDNWGATWAQRGANTTWRGIASNSTGQRLVAVVWTGGLYYTSDRGDNWTGPVNFGTQLNKTYNGVASDSTGEYLVTCVHNSGGSWANDAFVWHSRNGGTTWTADSSATARTYTSVASDSTGKYIVATVSTGRVIYLATNGDGSNALNLTATTVNISAASANWTSACIGGTNGSIITAVIYGDYGVGSRGIFRSIDSGTTWGVAVDANSRNYYGVSSAADGTGLAAVVNGGSIYTSY
jgi:hypothetical protein